jgi:hypothetical protein
MNATVDALESSNASSSMSWAILHILFPGHWKLKKYDSNVEQVHDVSDLINSNESFPLERESELVQQASESRRKRRRRIV